MWTLDESAGQGWRSLVAAFILATVVAVPLALALGLIAEAPQPLTVSLDTTPPPPVQLAGE